jgi:hypothetical protein
MKAIFESLGTRDIKKLSVILCMASAIRAASSFGLALEYWMTVLRLIGRTGLL